jgi:hypothetical protein
MLDANVVRFYLCSLPVALFAGIVVLTYVWVFIELRRAPMYDDSEEH